MAYAARQRFTFDEYLLLEDVAGVKHEYLDGQAWAMADGSPEHAGVAGSVLALLAARRHGKPCRVFSSDLRVRVTATGLGTYPDVTVVCGSLELDPEDKKGHTVTILASSSRCSARRQKTMTAAKSLLTTSRFRH